MQAVGFRSLHGLLVASVISFVFVAGGCSESEDEKAKIEPAPAPVVDAIPDDLPNGLLLVLSRFGRDEAGEVTTMPARLVILLRKGGEWTNQIIDDPDSNVFHKAMAYDPPHAEPGILTIGAQGAALKLWRKGEAGFEAETLWKTSFGGKFDRLRDMEIANLYGDEGGGDIAIATHDQGVMAIVHPNPDGSYEARQIDKVEDGPFIHEVEIGDLDGDGVLELYATPSAPNKLDGTPQPGKVVRYIPGKGGGAELVADLGTRHAKEILVEDVDGDGRDELYVSVEDPVEILRFDAGTAVDAGQLIGQINDKLSRFLTAGDLDGDGKKELIAATYKRGIWKFSPGEDPHKEWVRSVVDRESGGFEHASILADLDGDARDELYVASDKDAEVRRYVWTGTEYKREVIYRRTGSAFTWNIMPVPANLVAGR